MKEYDDRKVAHQVTNKEMRYTSLDRQHEANDDKNGVQEPNHGPMHDHDKRQQHTELMRQISSDRDTGHVVDEKNDIEVDDSRFGRRGNERSKRPKKAKKYREWGPESRKSIGKHLPRGGRKRKFTDNRDMYDNYPELEDNFSEDNEDTGQSASDISGASRPSSPQEPRVETARPESWSWKPTYHEARYYDERKSKAAKRRPAHHGYYERETPMFSPFIGDTRRYYLSPTATELRLDDMFSQMLHRQDSMLMRLDTIVNLLQKTVKAITAKSSHGTSVLPNESNSFQDNEVQSSLRRTRKNISDSETEGEYCRPWESEKAQHSRHMNNGEKGRKGQNNNGNNSRSFVDLDVNKPSASHNGGRTEMRDNIAPRIASYFSVRRKSSEFYHREQDYRDDMGEGESILSQLTTSNRKENYTRHKQSVKEKARNGNGAVEKSISREETSNEKEIAPDEKLHAKESSNELNLAAIKRNCNDGSETMGYSVAVTYSKEKTNDTQRGLKINERPSMVDLSQTSNMILPQKYYTINKDAFSSSNVDAINSREMSLFGDEAIPCVYPGQGWQTANEIDPISPPCSHRRRDNSEYKAWLARTFTTGSGHSEDFPRSMVTKGNEARSTSHNEAKSLLTDNKKMMSSIAHLVLSSIDVTSEIVQILVATPSDNNSNKDHSRKSMECLLNQSLALMGCLPLIAEIDLSVVQKIYQSSKNCMSFIYRLMDHCYAREELMRCRVAGGVRRYRGNNTETEQLCPKRLRTVLKLASDLFPNEYIKLSKANMIRNNINMKCRKTVIRDIPN